MKLHEPIDMGCESVDTILHHRESLVHLLTEITKLKMDDPKLPVYLAEPRVRLPEATPNKFFEGGELLIDGSRFLGRFLFCHMFSLAAATWTESQHEIWVNSLIADEIDTTNFLPAAPRPQRHTSRMR